MFYSSTQFPDRRRPKYTPASGRYGPAPYQLPPSERPGADKQLEVDLTPMSGSVGHTAGPDIFRHANRVDPEVAARMTATRVALDAERDGVRLILGLDEPLDPGLTFTDQVEVLRTRIDLALNEPEVGPMGGLARQTPVAAGGLALAGAVAQ